MPTFDEMVAMVKRHARPSDVPLSGQTLAVLMLAYVLADGSRAIARELHAMATRI